MENTENSEIKIKSTAKERPNEPITEEGQIALDIFENKNEFIIIAPIAGIDREDIQIMINEDILVIKGERKYPTKVKEKDFLVKECYFGPFSRAIILPRQADLKQIKALFNKNILEIKIKKDTSPETKIVEIE